MSVIKENCDRRGPRAVVADTTDIWSRSGLKEGGEIVTDSYKVLRTTRPFAA